MQSISCVGSANWRDAQLRFSMSKFCIRVNCFAVAIMGSVAHPCNGNHRANVKLLKVSCLVEKQNCDVRKSANFATVRSGARSGRYLKTIYRGICSFEAVLVDL
jgi:hypothetical protein